MVKIVLEQFCTEKNIFFKTILLNTLADTPNLGVGAFKNVLSQRILEIMH